MTIQNFLREWAKFDLPTPENIDRERDFVKCAEIFTFEVDSEPTEQNTQMASDYFSEVHGQTLIESGQSIGSWKIAVTINTGFAL